ncbi:unnamed protein product [Pedinophyceae sp. YPF-701]|nr:unnamed protein product [Pedinophyceae sp. YPF-701]
MQATLASAVAEDQKCAGEDSMRLARELETAGGSMQPTEASGADLEPVPSAAKVSFDEACPQTPPRDYASAKPARVLSPGKTTIARVKTIRPDSEMRWDDLELISVLGKGGFGEVLHMRHRDPMSGRERDVAVKLLLPGHEAKEDDVLSYVREAEMLRLLEHPHIVQFEGIGLTTGDPDKTVAHRDARSSLASEGAAPELGAPERVTEGTGAAEAGAALEVLRLARHNQLAEGAERLFVVQELCLGGSLRDLIRKHRVAHGSRSMPYRWDAAFRWLCGTAKALQHLHRNDIIHRDVKLENILIKVPDVESRECRALLADMGLARLMADKKEQLMRTVTKWISSGTRPRSSGLRRASGRKSVDSSRGEGSGLDTSLSVPRQLSIAQYRRMMSRGRPSQLNTQADVQHHEALALTGCTGSLMYMAPEVLLQKPYNESADVFSFGLCMYEVLMMRLQITDVLAARGFAGDTGFSKVQQHALQVARGYRPKVPRQWPAEVKALLSECWSQQKEKRPTMAQVVSRLEGMMSSGVVSDYVHTYQVMRPVGAATKGLEEGPLPSIHSSKYHGLEMPGQDKGDKQGCGCFG